MGNPRNGLGVGITKTVQYAVETTFSTTDSVPRGFKTRVNGLVKLKAVDDADWVEVYCIAGAYNLYNLSAVAADGAVALSDIEFFF